MSKKTKLTTTGIVVFFILGMALIGSEPEPTLPECSDGIDNDGDGDYDDFQEENCYAAGIYCPNWNSETIAITDFNDCN